MCVTVCARSPVCVLLDMTQLQPDSGLITSHFTLSHLHIISVSPDSSLDFASLLSTAAVFSSAHSDEMFSSLPPQHTHAHPLKACSIPTTQSPEMIPMGLQHRAPCKEFLSRDKCKAARLHRRVNSSVRQHHVKRVHVRYVIC